MPSPLCRPPHGPHLGLDDGVELAPGLCPVHRVVHATALIRQDARRRRAPLLGALLLPALAPAAAAAAPRHPVLAPFPARVGVGHMSNCGGGGGCTCWRCGSKRRSVGSKPCDCNSLHAAGSFVLYVIENAWPASAGPPVLLLHSGWGFGAVGQPPPGKVCMGGDHVRANRIRGSALRLPPRRRTDELPPHVTIAHVVCEALRTLQRCNAWPCKGAGSQRPRCRARVHC